MLEIPGCLWIEELAFCGNSRVCVHHLVDFGNATAGAQERSHDEHQPTKLLRE